MSRRLTASSVTSVAKTLTAHGTVETQKAMVAPRQGVGALCRRTSSSVPTRVRDGVTIFGVSWQELDLEAIRRFFRDAGSEPLLWEAKGTDLNRGEIREQVCGFANSHDGGYLILGATEHGGAWTLDGVPFSHDPPAWISDVIGNGTVTPYPDGLDTKAWPVGHGRLRRRRVDPADAHPALEHPRPVFERVSGKTVPVTEPLRLAALFDRGDAARKTAQEKAKQIAMFAINRANGEHRAQSFTQFGLGLAATGYQAGISSRLFSYSFEQGVLSSMSTVLTHDPTSRDIRWPIRGDMAQDRRSFATYPHDELGALWVATISWNGGVSMFWSQGGRQGGVELACGEPLREAWLCLEEILSMLGAQGPRYLSLFMAGPMFLPDRVTHMPPKNVQRGPLERDVNSTTLKSIERELRRATGEAVYEPAS